MLRIMDINTRIKSFEYVPCPFLSILDYEKSTFIAPLLLSFFTTFRWIRKYYTLINAFLDMNQKKKLSETYLIAKSGNHIASYRLDRASLKYRK